MKTPHFLWRESFIDYLWATETTGKHYFFHSGYFVYRQGVLSAYATDDEIEAVRVLTSNLIDDPQKILNIEIDFAKVRNDIATFHTTFSKLDFEKISNTQIYNFFREVIVLFGKFISVYRLTEPHLVQHLENKARTIVLDTQSNTNIDAILADILSSEKGFMKYGLEKYQDLFNVIRYVSRMRFEAKQITENLSSDIARLISVVSTRKKYTIPQVANMSLHELEDLLVVGGSVNVEVLNKRMEGFGLEIHVNKDDVTITELSEDDIRKINDFENAPTDCIKGKSVYPGKVQGTAKIVPALLSEKGYNTFIDQLKRGDIIVAPMTSPHLAMGFAKVSGVITDEGGLMSHAALISREYKIPCVVGTKNATRVLKDGDAILLDADAGVIVKI